jgi:hypothetical protein
VIPYSWSSVPDWQRIVANEVNPALAKLGNFTFSEALGDGASDDTAALQKALNTGNVVLLKGGATYIITSGLDHVNNAGFDCLDGVATIKARTGSGGFNITSAAAPRTALDRNMLRCNGTDGLFLRNIHFTTDGANEVYLNGIRFVGGMGVEGYDIDGISFSGFFNGSLVSFNSVASGKRARLGIVSAADCGITQGSSRFTAGAQTTVVEIDNDIISSTPSAPGVVRIGHIKDILYTGTALTDFGQQTDGVNIICQGAHSTAGWAFDIGIIDGVGEPLDIQGWGNSFKVERIKNAYNYGVKLIHGAQFNTFDIGNIDASGLSAVGLFGSSSAICDRDTLANVINVRSITYPGIYGLGPGAAAGDVAAVLFGNTTSTYKPKQNVTNVGSIIGDGVNMDYLVKDGGSSNSLANFVNIWKGSGYAAGQASTPAGNVHTYLEMVQITS